MSELQVGAALNNFKLKPAKYFTALIFFLAFPKLNFKHTKKFQFNFVASTT